MSDDLNYYRRRAEHELRPTRRAMEPKVAAAHERLAEAYLLRVASLETAARTAHV